MFRQAGKSIRPLELNILKGLIALILLLATVLIGRMRISQGDLTPPVFWLLAASGVSGIGIGDTLFFGALQSIGSRRTLLIQMLSPPMAAIISYFALSERIPSLAWAGIVITVCGIAWVITERNKSDSTPVTYQWKGIGYAALAALASAAGVVFAHSALTQSRIDLLWSVIIRLGAGVAFLLVWLIFQAGKRPAILPGGGALWRKVLIASFIGTYIALLLNQTALRYAPAGVAQTLLSTSPLFVLPIGLLAGERLTLRAVGGAVLAMAGIALFFMR